MPTVMILSLGWKLFLFTNLGITLFGCRGFAYTQACQEKMHKLFSNHRPYGDVDF